MPEQYSRKPVLRRPLLGLALCCVLGISCGVFVGGIPARDLCLAAVSALIASLIAHWAAHLPGFIRRAACVAFPAEQDPSTRRRPSAMVGICSALSLVFLYLAILLAAWLDVTLYLHNPSGCELAALMNKPREGIELVGVVADDPCVRSTRSGTNCVWDFPLRVEMIRRLSSWQKARGTVRVSLRDLSGSASPHYGERWRLDGVLVDHARFPDVRPVLEWMNNRYAFTATSATSACLAAGQGVPLMNWCFRGRRQAADCLARGIDHRPEIVGLLQALLLGYRQELPDKRRRDFIATGTYHIFAISGQHVAVLALFIIVVLQAQRVCRIKWFLYVAPLLIAFTLSTGLSSSAVRGCLMALLVFLGPLLRRKPDLPSAMALAAILILAVDPLQLFNYGFLLSFGVVAGLIVFCPPMLKLVEPWLIPDPWRLEPERSVVQFWRNIFSFFALLLVSSLAAWLVSTPLIARWFNLVSPIALLANLVVIPVSTLVLLAGCLSIMFGAWLPWLGEVFNFANVVLVSFLLSITDSMARIPWGHFFVVAPPVWALLIWFGSLLALVSGWGVRKFWLAGPVLLALALLGSVILNWNRVSADITNVGDVPVCLIKAPGTAPMLVHAGPGFYGQRVTQKLQQLGVNHLSALALPAVDAPHIGGVLDILAAFRVKELWCAATNSRAPVFKQMLTVARAQNIPIRVLTNNAWMAWCGNLDSQYQAASNAFLVRCGKTVFKVGWGGAMLGQDVLEMVTVGHTAPDGMPAALCVRCVEPGQVMPETGGVHGAAVMGLIPGQSVRVSLNAAGRLVEPWRNH